VELGIVDPIAIDGQLVSSSRVRGLIEQGDVDSARRLLTKPYRIRGMVTHGAKRGSRIGFPTANLSAIDTLMPGLGVYAGRSYFEGRVWASAINVGANPTFHEQALKVEVHLIHYQGNLYGAPLEVDFLGRLRDIHPFASVEELRTQLANDVANAERLAAEAEGADVG
jgi:riboflavin kinase/FMN adenylyltransferase